MKANGLNPKNANDCFETHTTAYDIVQWNPRFLSWEPFGYDGSWAETKAEWALQSADAPDSIFRIVLVSTDTETTYTDATSLAKKELGL